MKARIRNVWDRLFYKPEPLGSGIFQKNINIEGQAPFRAHLRIEKDGNGILILNARTVLHLNQTATEYARHLLMDTPTEKVAQEISKRYRISSEQALADYKEFVNKLEVLRDTPDLDPEIFLDFDRVEPNQQRLSAPLRLDCALTYQTSSGDSDEVAPVKAVIRNLDTEEWKTILEKAWNAGIPHIVFTGGEPTLRPDLVDLIQFSQNLGQVTGLITDGTRLTEKDYLHNLLNAGLDHLMLVMDPEESQTREALKDALVEDISVSVHLTLTPRNSDLLGSTLDHIAQLGHPQISLSTNSPAIRDHMADFQRIVAERGFSLVWNLPVPYSASNPINLELESAHIEVGGPGNRWLYVEPDGDVLPGQGMKPVLGNFLTDSFEKLWENARTANQ